MENKKYAIETRFYNSGRIDVGQIEKVGFEQESRMEEKETHDYYYSVFPSLSAARQYREECLREKYGE